MAEVVHQIDQPLIYTVAHERPPLLGLFPKLSLGDVGDRHFSLLRGEGF